MMKLPAKALMMRHALRRVLGGILCFPCTHQKNLYNIVRIIESHCDEIVTKWVSHFGSVSFCCQAAYPAYAPLAGGYVSSMIHLSMVRVCEEKFTPTFTKRLSSASKGSMYPFSSIWASASSALLSYLNSIT